MNREINQCEIELNRYFKTLEQDLEKLKKDKNSNQLKKKINSNLETIPFELEMYESFAEDLTGNDKNNFDINYKAFQTKLKDLQSKFQSLTNTKSPSIAEKNIDPRKIEEVEKKINICNLQRLVKRTTGFRFGRSNSQ